MSTTLTAAPSADGPDPSTTRALAEYGALVDAILADGSDTR